SVPLHGGRSVRAGTPAPCATSRISHRRILARSTLRTVWTGALTFGELIERHEREIFVYALRLVGSRDGADDLYQETFLAAFRAVAAALGCSEEAARSRVAEAMKKVKEATR